MRSRSAGNAVGEVFGTDEPPRFVLVFGGPIVLLAERVEVGRGATTSRSITGWPLTGTTRRQRVTRNDRRAVSSRRSCRSMARRCSRVGRQLAQTCGGGSKELRIGIRDSIEILANEVIDQRVDRRHVDMNRQAVHPVERRCPRAHSSVSSLPVSVARVAVRGDPPRAGRRAGQR